MTNQLSLKLLKFLIVIIFLLVLAVLPLTLKADIDSIKFTPNVTIPGSVFRAHEALPIAPAGDLVMVKYIIALYNFFVGIAGIIAVFMIVFGGVLWLFSGGSSERISKAKEIIVGSITGLLLALGSYMILNTVNPNLTTFKVSIDALDAGRFSSVGGQEAKVCNYEVFKNKAPNKDKDYLQCGFQFKDTSQTALQSELECLFARCSDSDDVCTNDFVFPTCRSRVNGLNFFKSGITYVGNNNTEVNLSQVTFEADEHYSCGYIYAREERKNLNGQVSYNFKYYIGSDCPDDPVCCSLCFVDKNFPKQDLNQITPVDIEDMGTYTTEEKIRFPAANCYDRGTKGIPADDKW